MSQYYYNPFGNSVNEEQERAFLRRQQENREKKEIRRIGLAMGAAIVAYIVIQNLVTIIMISAGLYDLYKSSAVFQSAFTVIAVSFCCVALPFGIMAWANRKKYESPIIPNTPIKASRCAAWVSLGMMCCTCAQFVVSYIIAFLQLLFDVEFTQGEALEPDSVLACVMAVISTAIIPGICEEFAMRCCSLQLLKKYGKGFAVFAVSIVFGILHGNVIQFIFAFIVGLVLGFVTVKTDSAVPAVLIHSLSNGVSAVSSIVKYAAGEDMAHKSVILLYAFWMISGVIGGIYLLSKGEFKARAERNKTTLSVLQRFTAFLFPGMVLPFIILIYLTVQTIK